MRYIDADSGVIIGSVLCEAGHARKCAPCREYARDDLRTYLRSVGGMSYLRQRAAIATSYAQQRGAPGVITARWIARELYDWYCACANVDCGSDFLTVPFEIDHKLPVSRGGTSEPSNLQLLCCHCNQEKGILTMHEWHLSILRPHLCPICDGMKTEGYLLCYRCTNELRQE